MTKHIPDFEIPHFDEFEDKWYNHASEEKKEAFKKQLLRNQSSLMEDSQQEMEDKIEKVRTQRFERLQKKHDEEFERHLKEHEEQT